MDVGQEMDRLIAERVFGERVERESGCLWLDGPEPMRLTRPLPAYSTEIAAAWQVFEKITAVISGHEMQIHRFWRASRNDWGWAVSRQVYSAIEIIAEGGTAPEAICRAALIAVCA